MTNTVTALDATFLELEEQSEGALMHSGGVMVFDRCPMAAHRPWRISARW
jgi:hypothetical protein